MNARPTAPSWEFWFGTDQLSRDMFSRTIWGARISLTVGFAAIAFGMLVGGSLGMIAGYFRGQYNAVISFVLRRPPVVSGVGAGDPDHLAARPHACSRSRSSIGILAVAPVGMVSRAIDRLVRRPRVRARRAHARCQAPAHHRA